MSNILNLLIIKSIVAFRRKRRHVKPDVEPIYFGVLIAVLVLHAVVIVGGWNGVC
jgi:hypothetical protein